MNYTYGTVKPTLVDPEKDVEIYYHYRPTRSSNDTEFENFKKIEDVASMFSNSTIETDDTSKDARLPGMYNLNLPVSIFGKKGIYTIYIKPKEIRCTIKDIGALAAFPDVKGIVIDVNSIDNDSTLFGNDNLVGYRVEYFSNDNEEKRQEYYRLITSANRCEPVSQNLTSANTSSNGYRFNGSGTLCFLTVTPSTSPGFKSNSKPYIGAPNQQIVITNTKFDPVMIEVEMVEHDIETLSIMTEGEQVRNLETGTVTTYNFNGEIYHQDEFSRIKDNYTKRHIAELKRNRNGNLDTSLDLEQLKEV